mgnify:CR=1 FL=1
MTALAPNPAYVFCPGDRAFMATVCPMIGIIVVLIALANRIGVTWPIMLVLGCMLSCCWSLPPPLLGKLHRSHKRVPRRRVVDFSARVRPRYCDDDRRGGRRARACADPRDCNNRPTGLSSFAIRARSTTPLCVGSNGFWTSKPNISNCLGLQATLLPTLMST